MAKQRNTEAAKDKNKPATVTVGSRIPAELAAALDSYVNSVRPKTTHGATIELAIEEFLAKRKRWTIQESQDEAE